MTEKIKKQIDAIFERSGVNPRKCMKCGKCSGTCPAYNEMEYHPHEFIYMVEKGNLEPLLNSNALYYCLSCLACLDRCPRNVKPAKLIESVRLAMIRQQGHNHLTADDVADVLDPYLPQQALVSAFRKYSK